MYSKPANNGFEYVHSVIQSTQTQTISMHARFVDDTDGGNWGDYPEKKDCLQWYDDDYYVLLKDVKLSLWSGACT